MLGEINKIFLKTFPPKTNWQFWVRQRLSGIILVTFSRFKNVMYKVDDRGNISWTWSPWFTMTLARNKFHGNCWEVTLIIIKRIKLLEVKHVVISFNIFKITKKDLVTTRRTLANNRRRTVLCGDKRGWGIGNPLIGQTASIYVPYAILSY